MSQRESQWIANGYFRTEKKDEEKTQKVLEEAGKKSEDAIWRRFYEEDGSLLFSFTHLDWDTLKTLLPFEEASFPEGHVMRYSRNDIIKTPCVFCGGELIRVGNLPKPLNDAVDMRPCFHPAITCLRCGLLYSMPPAYLTTPRLR